MYISGFLIIIIQSSCV